MPFPPLWATEPGPWAPFLAGLDGPRRATRCLGPPKKGEQARDTPSAHRWQGAPSRASLPGARPAHLPAPGGSPHSPGSHHRASRQAVGLVAASVTTAPAGTGGSLSEGGAASGGPLRTRVPDALSGRAQPERPLCPAHWQPHKRCSHGSALGEVQTSPPHRATPGRCPPSIQRLPSPNPSAVSTPWPSICSSAGWSTG